MIITFEDANTVDMIYVNGLVHGHIAHKPHMSCMAGNFSEIVPPMVMLTRPASELVRFNISKKVCQREGSEREIVFRDPPPKIPARMRY